MVVAKTPDFLSGFPEEQAATGHVRHGTLTVGGDTFRFMLQDLPTVVESYKTFDDVNLVKMEDVGQVRDLTSASSVQTPQKSHVCFSTKHKTAQITLELRIEDARTSCCRATPKLESHVSEIAQGISRRVQARCVRLMCQKFHSILTCLLQVQIGEH